MEGMKSEMQMFKLATLGVGNNANQGVKPVRFPLSCDVTGRQTHECEVERT